MKKELLSRMGRAALLALSSCLAPRAAYAQEGAGAWSAGLPWWVYAVAIAGVLIVLNVLFDVIGAAVLMFLRRRK